MKNFLVIGGGSAIGKATIKQLNSNEFKIFATFNASVVKDPNIETLQFDVVKDDFQRLSEFLPDELHGLVYCPGSIDLKPFHRIKADEFIKDFELQTLGAIRSIQTALNALKKANCASVVLFSTVAVQTGFPYHSLVSSSKGAIEGLTRSLASEYAPKIRFNAIAPSLVESPLSENFINNEKKLEANASRHPLKRIGQAEDIAKAVKFLLLNSEWVTAQILHVDGGISSIKT